MSTMSYRHARVDPGFLFGRAHGLTVALIRMVEGAYSDAAVRAELRLSETSATPARLAVELARTWAQLGPRARRANPEGFADIEREYLRAISGAEVESLPERLPRTEIRNEALAAWSAAMLHGYHHELMMLSGRQLQAAREQQALWVETAKAAALEAIAAGVPEAEAARRVGLDRMTLRKAQGK